MKVRKVVLENVRSHKRSEVEFGDGFNCIVGGVGAGKTSILYAIHFGLLGERLGKSYSYLLREGQNSARVTLHFEQEGKEYRVERVLVRKGDRISQDPSELALYEEDRLIASAKAEAVNEQIKSITGIDYDTFKNVIWVQQEKLKEILDVEPSRRQEVLDRLFGISDFFDAWERLRGFEREYEGEKGALERDPDIVGLGDLRKRCNEGYESLVKLHLLIEDLKSQVDQLSRRYREADERVRELEQLRKEAEVLEREKATLKARLQEIEKSARRAKEIVEKQEAEVAELESKLDDLSSRVEKILNQLAEAGLKAESPAELEEIEADLRNQEMSLMAKREELKNEIETLVQQRRILASEEKCPLCQRLLTDEHRRLVLGALEMKEGAFLKQLDEVKLGLERLEARHKLLKTSAKALAELWRSKDKLEGKLSDRIASLEESRAALQGLERESSKIERRLAEIKVPKMDLKLIEEAARKRDQAYQSLASARSELEAKRAELQRLDREVSELKKRVEQAEEKARRKAKVETILDFVGKIRSLYRSVGPKLRKDLVEVLRDCIQRILYEMTEGLDKHYMIEIGDDYTPRLREAEHWRDLPALSGGERTMSAFAYRIGIGQLIMDFRGRPLDFLILDEPTESLGPEDGSIERLAKAVASLRSIGQIISVTHSEDFAKLADYTIRVEKRAGKSVVSYVR